MLIYIDFLIKYGSYGLITILALIIFFLSRWIVNNHLASIKLMIGDVDRTVKALHKRLDEEEIVRDKKDEEQGKEIVAIQKDIEYISKDIKRIYDKTNRYNGKLNSGE